MKTQALDPKTADWNALGLRCGVEIHQQLDTEQKLFCRCPAGRYSERVDARVLRHMRPTLSELGEYDGTALMEFKTQKNITYLLDRRTVCTYEMDDTPPFEINREAVDIALDICLAIGCQIVGEIHVIRKQYLDGSIPTGFQRTAIIGVGGSIPHEGKEIGIIQVSLEEDSCREVSDRGHDIVFRTDRLSMPLVEVVTEPDMVTPDEAAAVVRTIGRIMRTTGRVRRGAGASRQDVNVSVAGGTRVEIKGVPSISLISDLVAGEGVRQRALLDVREELGGSVDVATIESSPARVEWAFEKTRCRPLADALADGRCIKAMRIPGMRETLDVKVGVGRTVADELAGRVRVIACLDRPPIVLHASNRELWGISDDEWRAARKRTRAKAPDAVVVLFGEEADVDLGMREILDRVRELWDGIPGETRQVWLDGQTDFERILPGPDRMYPDTDSPPLAVPDEWLEKLRAGQRESLWDREARLRDQGLPADVVDDLAISPRLELYDVAVGADVGPVFAGVLLSQRWVALRRAGCAVDEIPTEWVAALLEAVGRRVVLEAAAPLLLEATVEEPGVSLEALVKTRRLEPVDEEVAKARAAARIEAAPKPETSDRGGRHRYYMGEVMQELRGRFPGAGLGVIVEGILEDLR